MRNMVFLSCLLGCLACHADELWIATTIRARSHDSLEFVLNGHGKYGEKPLAAYFEDMSGALIAPKWFSKIDGKWKIVP